MSVLPCDAPFHTSLNQINYKDNLYHSSLFQIEPWDLALSTFQKLHYPFERKINEHANEAQTQTDQWAKEFKIVPEPYFEKLCASLFAFLMAHVHPYCDLQKLCRFSQWVTMIFVYDDTNEKILSKDISKLKEFNAKNLAIIQGTNETKEDDNPLPHVIDNLIKNLKPWANENWLKRFIKDIEEHFDSMVWEAENARKIPSLEDYLKMRPFTGGVYIMFDLIELAEGTSIPDRIFNHSFMREIKLVANQILFESNDIISFPKESPLDGNNIVYVLQNELKCSLDEAVVKAEELHNQEMKKFLDLINEMPDFGEHNQQVKKYIDGLCFWLRGHYDWAPTSDRYKRPTTQVPPTWAKA